MVAEDSGSSDYQAFLRNSRVRLAAEFEGADLSPNDLVIILNRASGVATSLAESKIHRPRAMSWNAFRVMLILWMEGDLEQHRVVALAGTGRATTSATVKSLVTSGHLFQRPSTVDKRAHVLSLTDQGRALIRESYIEQNELLREWTTRLTHTEQEILKALLLKLLSGRG